MRKLLLAAVCFALSACDAPASTTPFAAAPAAPTLPPAGPTAPPTVAPTATPTASPTASPPPGTNPLSPLPTALSLTQTGAAAFTVTEVGYRGQYSVSSTATGVVTVTTPVTSAADTTQIAIDAVAPGSADVIVSDTNGQSVTVPVGVTITPVTIQRVGVKR